MSNSTTPSLSPARVGVFGGTFDPIHLAHLIIAQEALAQLALDRVLFIPTGQPPHKARRMISTREQRRAMVERAIAADSRFALTTMELDRDGPSYTVDTLTQLHATAAAPIAIMLILGGDMVYDLVNWHDAAGIVRKVAGIVAIQRPGYPFTDAALAHLEAQVPGLSARIKPIDAPQLAISSTLIRERVARNMPIRYLVPDAVAEYIDAARLYQGAAAQEVGL